MVCESVCRCRLAAAPRCGCNLLALLFDAENSRKVITADHSAPDIADALIVLQAALENCRDSDQRTPKVIDAIRVLLRHADERWPFVQFWQALGDTGSQEGRWQTGHAALNGIRLTIGLEQR